MVAGVHFLPDDPPGDIAAKLVRVNLSDLAAKGAVPYGVLLSAAFPRHVSTEWLTAFAAGLGEDLRGFGVALLGGDTVSTPGPLTLSLTALGRVGQGRALLRSGGTVGETVWVSGTIGDGALGLLASTGVLTADPFLVERYRRPRPRTTLGPRLVGLARASMDVSDGLVQDLGHLCRASGVGAEIEAARVPLSAATKVLVAAEPSLLATVLTGGDDYELLFTAPAEAEAALLALSAELGVPLSAIGRLHPGAGVTVRGEDGGVLALGRGGWKHFGGQEP
jgi:thiamine-monophosphate kinase